MLVAEVEIIHFEDGRRGHKPRQAAAEAGKGKGMDSPLDPAGVMWSCSHLEFGSAKLISNFWPPELLEYKSVLF